jgi:hypothetical protein
MMPTTAVAAATAAAYWFMKLVANLFDVNDHVGSYSTKGLIIFNPLWSS